MTKSEVKDIKRDESILFLGPEFSGKMGIPSYAVIAQILSNKFNISGDYQDNINLVVSEIENSYEDGRKKIVEEVYNLLESCSLDSQIYSIPVNRWKAIYTWNIDTSIEKAFEQCSEAALQKLLVVTDATELFSVNDPDAVCLFKLNGCIRSPLSRRAKLVLTRQDHASTESNRLRLISFIKDIYPPINCIFMGFTLNEELLRIVAQVQELTYKAFDAFVITSLAPDQTLQREFRNLGAHIVSIDLVDFLSSLKPEVPLEKPLRVREEEIRTVVPTTDLVKITYDDYKKYSAQLLIYCDYEFEKDRTINKGKTARDFYEGEEIWLSGLEQKLPIHRDVLKRLVGSIEKDLSPRETSAKFKNKIFMILYDHPGAGGTTLLKSLGYKIYEKKTNPVLMIKPIRHTSRLDFDRIVRFCEKFNSTPLILIDNASMEKDNFKFLYTLFESRRTPATFVIAARQEEWKEDYYIDFSYFTDEENMDEPKTSEESGISKTLPLKEIGLKGEAKVFPLYEKLSEAEKHHLFTKVIENRLIDAKKLSADFESFKALYDDDILLVLLYKILKNTRFEIAIVDEYKSLEKEDQSAAYAYKLICALDALKLKMSWELLRRILNCDWNYILNDLKVIFENVVKPDFDMETNLFKARHQIIAEKLFDILYDSPDKKLSVFKDIIENVSPNNEYERNLLRGIILNKKLHDSLGQISYSNKIFSFAKEVLPWDPVIIQHLGITFTKMEMYAEAEAAFLEALKYYPENPAVYNSQGILYEQIAFRYLHNLEPDEIKAGVYFNKAHEAFQKSITYGRDGEHGYDRYGRFLFKIGRYYGKDSKIWENIIGKIRGLIEDARDNVAEMRLNSIDNLEARLEAETGDFETAISLYKNILGHDKSNHNVRYNLAWIYFKKENYAEAIDILKPSIDEEIKEFRFYKLYSRLIRCQYPDKLRELITVLLQAHQIDSEDLDINFQLGVAYYKLGELSKSFSYFRNCDGLSYKRPDRFKTLTFYEEGGSGKVFGGNVKRIIHATRGYVTRDVYNDDIFFNPSRNDKVREGDRVKFNIGFCFVGPQAIDLRK